jgi:hypothetical protein
METLLWSNTEIEHVSLCLDSIGNEKLVLTRADSQRSDLVRRQTIFSQLLVVH